MGGIWHLESMANTQLRISSNSNYIKKTTKRNHLSTLISQSGPPKKKRKMNKKQKKQKKQKKKRSIASFDFEKSLQSGLPMSAIKNAVHQILEESQIGIQGHYANVRFQSEAWLALKIGAQDFLIDLCNSAMKNAKICYPSNSPPQTLMPRFMEAVLLIRHQTHLIPNWANSPNNPKKWNKGNHPLNLPQQPETAKKSKKSKRARK